VRSFEGQVPYPSCFIEAIAADIRIVAVLDTSYFLPSFVVALAFSTFQHFIGILDKNFARQQIVANLRLNLLQNRWR
jgi:hypothetical protein